MTKTSKYHGGLVFHRGRDSGIEQFCRIVASTLEDYGHMVERQSIIDPCTARVVTSQYMVELRLGELPEQDADGEVAGPRQRLTIAMSAAGEGYEDRDVSELMLVVMLYRMVDFCNAEKIEWLNPETVLTVTQFLSAFTSVSPRRVRSRQRTAADLSPAQPVAPEPLEPAAGQPDAAAEEEALARAFRCEADDMIEVISENEIRPNNVRRLATWGMTGMVAVISAPAAIPIAALNVVRGEDFRLNTQILSLTGLLTVLHGTGALANLADYLPI